MRSSTQPAVRCHARINVAVHCPTNRDRLGRPHVATLNQTTTNDAAPASLRRARHGHASPDQTEKCQAKQIFAGIAEHSRAAISLTLRCCALPAMRCLALPRPAGPRRAGRANKRLAPPYHTLRAGLALPSTPDRAKTGRCHAGLASPCLPMRCCARPGQTSPRYAGRASPCRATQRRDSPHWTGLRRPCNATPDIALQRIAVLNRTGPRHAGLALLRHARQCQATRCRPCVALRGNTAPSTALLHQTMPTPALRCRARLHNT
jgi:hypothetical protein